MALKNKKSRFWQSSPISIRKYVPNNIPIFLWNILLDILSSFGMQFDTFIAIFQTL